MKNEKTPKKLLNKRAFERRVDALRQKHAWFLKDKPLEIRPGWLDLLDATITKMKRMLSEEDIAFSHLEFLYCSTEYRMRLFVDGNQLSDRRFKAIDHLVEQAIHASERTCPKCGCGFGSQNFMRPNVGCDAHRDFDGDFAEDFRQHLKLKKQAEEDEVNLQQDQAESENVATTDKNSSVEVVADDTEVGPPQLRLYNIEEVHKLKQSIKTRSADADSRGRLKSICDDLIGRGEYRPYCRLPELEALDGLAKRFPNFVEVINVIRSAVALANLGNGILEVPPLLLLGPPGIGKTQVSNELAALFETNYLEIRMESEQSGAGISGSSEFWSNTQVGQRLTAAPFSICGISSP